MKDPFAAFAGVSNLLGEDADVYGGSDSYLRGTDEKKKKKKKSSGTFRLFQDEDDEDDYDYSGIFGTSGKSKSRSDLLKEYTNRFDFSSDFI